jgi:hypothetical protein
MSKKIEEAVYNMMNKHAGTVAKHLTNMYDTLQITDEDIEKMKNVTILEMAQQLEDGLINMYSLDENMSVLEFIKYYLAE